ncbi:methyltransferase domain-containing protein [Gordonia sp. L191]|uniref:class I SAM-dependent methyltransferase n=1 Tax=Gordonia sp. L191 TaxID=2982699 RepID=UPI0024BFF9CC|nr:methyltransferase domain-containing protein [Gordonia sp. L191]WHU45871.1 methyltransferase domain-containing protein [Gordonia sp. L191]
MGSGFYDRHLLPRLINLTCGSSLMVPLRGRVCAPLADHIVEVGFGSGHNIEAYPPTVTRVSAIEPSDDGWLLGADRITASPVPIDRAGLDGQSLPFPDNTFDGTPSTFTMCTIAAALTDAGFEITEFDRFHHRGTPKTFGAMSLGGARAR